MIFDFFLLLEIICLKNSADHFRKSLTYRQKSFAIVDRTSVNEYIVSWPIHCNSFPFPKACMYALLLIIADDTNEFGTAIVSAIVYSIFFQL